MGCTDAKKSEDSNIILNPLNYPVRPSNKVLYPDVKILNNLLSGNNEKEKPIKIGTLINRPDVEIFFNGEALCSRHLAILAQTGGGKTVASRRIIAGLSQYGHPLVIFDPHGDYLGLSRNLEKLKEISGNGDLKVKLFTPKLLANKEKVADAISEIVIKLGLSMTEAQIGVFESFVKDEEFIKTLNAAETNLLKHLEKLEEFVSRSNLTDSTSKRSVGPILRKIKMIKNKLYSMEATNRSLRDIFVSKGLNFEDMPDPELSPNKIVDQNQISLFFLGCYERVVQSTIVSIILENLFENRSSMKK